MEGAARVASRRGAGEGRRRARGRRGVEVAGALGAGAAWRPMPGALGGAEAGPASTAGASRTAGVEGSGVETARRWTTKHGGGGGRSGVEGASRKSTIGH